MLGARLQDVDGELAVARQKAALQEVLEQVLLTTAQSGDRVRLTVNKLQELSVKSVELLELVATARSRDRWRELTTVFRSGCSFVAAGAIGVALVDAPAFDPKEYEGTMAADVARRNAYLAYALGVLAMGVGGQMAATVVRDGKLGRKYTQAAPVLADGGQLVPYAETTRAAAARRLAFYPFAVNHATVGSGVLNLERPGTARAFVVSTIVSAVETAMSDAVLNERLPPNGLDYPWLDASTPEKAQAMEQAIGFLRENSCVALGGYAKDFGRGIAGLATMPTMPTVKSMLQRLVIAVFATFPRVFYSLAQSPNEKAVLGVIAGLWIGLSWGFLLDTLPKPAPSRPAAAATAHAVAAVAPAPTTFDPAGSDLPLDDMA